MQVESFHLSPIEKELNFIQWRQQKGIIKILLDLDDTICPTQEVFSNQINKAIDCLAQQSNIPNLSFWKQEIKIINDSLFEKYGVNPNRWHQVITEFEIKYSLPIKTSQNLEEIFQNIYFTPLQYKAGAKEGLDFLKKTETPLAIITHANKDWTWRKYNWLGLDKYLDWDNVFIVDENGHKTAESWQAGLNYLKLKAIECAMIGDSPRSDINPAWNIGIKHCFWIKNPNLWSLHQQPVPPETIIINNLSEIANIGYQHLIDFKPRKTIF